MDSNLTARFEAALAADDLLAALARQLADEGQAQVEIYDCFFRFRQGLLAADRDPQAARIAVILDRIVGWCSPPERLFAAALTRAELAGFYANRPPANAQAASFDLAGLLGRYNRQQRLVVDLPGLEKQAGDRAGSPITSQMVDTRLVRFIYPNGDGLIVSSQLDPESVDPAIAGQAAHFRQAGAGLEWDVFAGDPPPDLGQRLARRGFHPGPEQTLLALDLSQVPEELLEPPGADLRPLTHPGRLEPALQAAEREGGLAEAALAHLAVRLRAGLQTPDRLAVYIGYTQFGPAGAGWVHFSPNSPFAELEGSPAWPPPPAGQMPA
jgi:hypothetical protein